MQYKTKKIQRIYILYWCMLAYIIAALIWWFIELNRQNDQMIFFKKQELELNDLDYHARYSKIEDEKRRKRAQYAGEGAIFLLLIVAGAVFVFRAVRRQLKQSQQQQNFMIAITHELKTPIAVSKLNLETVQKRKLDDQLREKLLLNTLEEINRMNALCNNMLLSSQIEAGGYRVVMEEIHFSEVVNKCIDDFKTRFPAKQINKNIDENIFVNGDRFLLEMVINNLIDNAIKYSHKEKAILIKLFSSGNDIHLSVIDEGMGIPDHEKKKIFGKFYRIGNEATRSAKGTGLGLYLTHIVVNEHHGKIKIKDNKPAGTIFEISLTAT